MSLAIVVIMGLFTWGYMRISANKNGSRSRYRLQEGDVSDTERNRLERIRSHRPADGPQLLGRPTNWGCSAKSPDPTHPVRVISNEGDQDVLVGYPWIAAVFGPPQEDVEDWAHQGVGERWPGDPSHPRYPPHGSADDQTAGRRNRFGPVFGKAPTANGCCRRVSRSSFGRELRQHVREPLWSAAQAPAICVRISPIFEDDKNRSRPKRLRSAERTRQASRWRHGSIRLRMASADRGGGFFRSAEILGSHSRRQRHVDYPGRPQAGELFRSRNQAGRV